MSRPTTVDRAGTDDRATSPQSSHAPNLRLTDQDTQSREGGTWGTADRETGVLAAVVTRDHDVVRFARAGVSVEEDVPVGQQR